MGRRAATPRADAGAHGGAGSADKPDKPFAGLRAQLRATTSTATAAPPPAKRIRHTLPPTAIDTSSQTPADSDLELFHKAAGKVQPVRGSVETLERAAAARPFIGIDRRDDRPDRAIVDRDPVGEQRSIRAPVARIERGGISGHDRHRRFPVKESVDSGRVGRHSSGTAS